MQGHIAQPIGVKNGHTQQIAVCVGVFSDKRILRIAGHVRRIVLKKLKQSRIPFSAVVQIIPVGAVGRSRGCVQGNGVLGVIARIIDLGPLETAILKQFLDAVKRIIIVKISPAYQIDGGGGYLSVLSHRARNADQVRIVHSHGNVHTVFSNGVEVCIAEMQTVCGVFAVLPLILGVIVKTDDIIRIAEVHHLALIAVQLGNGYLETVYIQI